MPRVMFTEEITLCNMVKSAIINLQIFSNFFFFFTYVYTLLTSEVKRLKVKRNVNTNGKSNINRIPIRGHLVFIDRAAITTFS